MSAEAAVQLRAGQELTRRYNVSHETRYYDRAREAFDQALSIDPGLAEVAAERAFLEIIRFEHTADRAVLDEVAAWARRARDLDEHNALGWAVLVPLSYYDGDMLAGVRPALRASSLDPRSTVAHNSVGIALASAAARLGVAAMQQAIALDPAYLYPLANAAGLRLSQDRAVEALRLADRALAVEPGMSYARMQRVLALVDLGRLDEAEEELARLQREAGEGTIATDLLAGCQATWALARAISSRGEEALAPAIEALLASVEAPLTGLSGEWTVVAVAALTAADRLDEALGVLERSTFTPFLPQDFLWLRSDLEPLRADPRFAAAAAPAGELFGALRAEIEAARAAGELPEYLEPVWSQLLDDLDLSVPAAKAPASGVIG